MNMSHADRTLTKRLRASIANEAVTRGDAFERGICARQMEEAANLIDRLFLEIQDLKEDLEICHQIGEDETRI